MLRLVLAALVGLAAAPPPLHVAFEQYRLPNGLTVILHEDHRMPEAVVDLWYRVGSKDERAGRSGFAHLFEHLMFMGTKNVPEHAFDNIMEAHGGSNNASTTEDRTNYFESGPSNLLATFLYLEADRMATLADGMTTAKLGLQRDVVKNERRQSIENRPYGKVELLLPEHLYPPTHPYHHPVIGSPQDLDAAQLDDVRAFFHEYYVPANASLVIAGDFQSAEAKQLVQKYFGWMPKRPPPPHPAPAPVALAKSETVRVADQVQLERVVLAWHSPAAFAAGEAACDLLASMLGGGPSSRLYRSLVYQQKIAQSIDVEQRGMLYDGNFVIVATAQPGHHAAELEHAISAELAELAVHPPSARELARARSFTETQVLRSVESLLGLADMLDEFELRFGDAGELNRRLLGRYAALTPADLARAAHATLMRPHLTIEVVPQ